MRSPNEYDESLTQEDIYKNRTVDSDARKNSKKYRAHYPVYDRKEKK